MVGSGMPGHAEVRSGSVRARSGAFGHVRARSGSVRARSGTFGRVRAWCVRAGFGHVRARSGAVRAAFGHVRARSGAFGQRGFSWFPTREFENTRNKAFCLFCPLLVVQRCFGADLHVCLSPGAICSVLQRVPRFQCIVKPSRPEAVHSECCKHDLGMSESSLSLSAQGVFFAKVVWVGRPG